MTSNEPFSTSQPCSVVFLFFSLSHFHRVKWLINVNFECFLSLVALALVSLVFVILIKFHMIINGAHNYTESSSRRPKNLVKKSNKFYDLFMLWVCACMMWLNGCLDFCRHYNLITLVQKCSHQTIQMVIFAWRAQSRFYLPREKIR